MSIVGLYSLQVWYRRGSTDMSGFVVAGSVRVWHWRRSVLLLLSEVCVVGDVVGLHKSGLVVIESALAYFALP